MKNKDLKEMLLRAKEKPADTKIVSVRVRKDHADLLYKHLGKKGVAKFLREAIEDAVHLLKK